ncbi:MAG: hypothetical protein RL662_2512 [Bacteroidota bacterium]|jgi:hypothetical protein
MRLIAHLIVLLILPSLFVACNNEDDFSTDAALRLTFSRDTLRFDTVFSEYGTATKQLKIYNRNSDALNITNVQLMNANKTGFRMNVDGESGNSINNVHILGNDSLYVFVEITVNPLNQNSPMHLADSIRFQFNGITQYIRLEAIGQDVIAWRGKEIDRDTTLTGEKPFLIMDSLSVKSGATLYLEKNVQLYFQNNASLHVHGRINAQGSIQQPVVMRGNRTDNLFETRRVPYDRVPGQWAGVKIAPKSYGNVFENVRIRNSVYGIQCYQSDTIQTKVRLTNTVIQNTSKDGLFAINSKIDAQNSLIVNAGGSPVKLIGGSSSFLHCTVANYIDFRTWGFVFRGEALHISNKGTDELGKPVQVAYGNHNFKNTIVAGASSSSELKIEQPSDNGVIKYSFINCLIKTDEKNEPNYVNTIWRVDPIFKYIYLRDTPQNEQDPDLYHFFDFQLTQASPARNKASRTYPSELPTDMTGTPRPSDEAPDIGCFEWK